MTEPSPFSPHGLSVPPIPFLEFQATKMLHTAAGKQLLDVRFQLAKGSILAIYGPSGAGKTTLLRILAGLTDADSGLIRLGGEAWLDTTRRVAVATRRRSIGFVFQDFALFPHLTVRQQLEFALPQGEEGKLIDELLSLMELEALQHHRPALLSGGQQQRVALARAIARRPGLLLLDEPLSALDEEMRVKLQQYIQKIHQRFRLTTVLVSHYLPEICRLADTAIVLERGRVSRQGSPGVIFGASPSAVAKIELTGTVIEIKQDEDRVVVAVRCGDTLLRTVATPAEAASLNVGQTVSVAFDASNPTILPLV
jgi:molybdate transport system ATP-binding protein